MKPYLYIIICFIFYHCSLMDLRKNIEIDPQNQVQPDKNPVEEISLDIKTIEGVDIWNSWFVRQFTPVEEVNQKFLLIPNKNNLQLTLYSQSNEKKIIGIEDEKTYEVVEGKKEYSESSKIKLYLKPLRNYIYWPIELLKKKYLLKAGKQKIGLQEYQIFYASKSIELEKDTDQYLLYKNLKTGKIDYIEFTLRELMKSYKGILSYTYIENQILPQTISVKDSIEDTEFIHKVVIEKINQKRE